MKSRKRTIAIILIIATAAAAVAAAVLLIVNAVSDREQNTGSIEMLTGADVKEAEASDDVLNIVFLGIDKQEDRSDIMMVLSINKTRNSINVVSLLRDSKVTIEGCSVGTKLGYAYKWGGEALALKTINTNFGTDLRNYITMEFEDAVAIVDAVGGVDIDVTEEEVPYLNSSAKSMGYTGGDIQAGVNTLDGTQAVAYARIRDIGGSYGEFYRSHRQQAVVKELFRKVRAMSSDDQLDFLDILAENMKSNMFMDELSVLTEMDMSALELNEYTIPDDEYEKKLWKGWEETPQTQPSDPLLDKSQWLWIYDLEEAGERLQSYLGGKNE